MSKDSDGEDLIQTTGEAGCIIKTVKFGDEGRIEQIDCHPPTELRYIR